MKKILALALTLALTLALLVACGGTTTTDGGDASTGDTTTNDTATGDTASKKITIGATATPHAEILEQVKEALAADGYELDIIVYDDYVLPNTALADGTLDANYFQHTPYLVNFNAENGTNLASAGLIHYEPFGLYGKNVADVASIPAGATIIVPADGSNETRALFLLAQEGLITLKDGANVTDGVTTFDIADNGGYNIVAVEASTIPAQFENADDGTAAVINGNYALQAGINIKDAIAVEDASGEAAQTYANIIACRAGDESSEKIAALVAALQTDAVKTYIESTYNEAVLPIF